MHDALIALGLGSVIILSLGFLALAVLMNRQMTKDANLPRRDDE